MLRLISLLFKDEFHLRKSVATVQNRKQAFGVEATPLHQVLRMFEPNSRNVTDIVDLARYAYEEEGKGGEDRISKLRGIVC